MATIKCAYCDKAFDTENPRRIYCSNACKQKKYDDKTGKDTFHRLKSKKWNEVLKEIEIEADNPEYIKLLEEIDQYQKQKKGIESILKFYQKEIEKLKLIIHNDADKKAENPTLIKWNKNKTPSGGIFVEIVGITTTLYNIVKSMKEKEAAEINIKQYQESIMKITFDISLLDKKIIA